VTIPDPRSTILDPLNPLPAPPVRTTHILTIALLPKSARTLSGMPLDVAASRANKVATTHRGVEWIDSLRKITG